MDGECVRGRPTVPRWVSGSVVDRLLVVLDFVNPPLTLIKGEMINSYGNRKYPKTILVKTHYPSYKEAFPVNRRVTSAIHVVRSPWDTFFSEFNREYAKGWVMMRKEEEEE